MYLKEPMNLRESLKEWFKKRDGTDMELLGVNQHSSFKFKEGTLIYTRWGSAHNKISLKFKYLYSRGTTQSLKVKDFS